MLLHRYAGYDLALVSRVDRDEIHGSMQRRPGRPRKAKELRELVVRMARENKS